jgi:hypothetical protein
VTAGKWHTVRVLESGTVLLEMKEGPYESLPENNILSI